MSKFLTNTIYLADNLQLFCAFQKQKNLQFFFLKSSKIQTLSLFSPEITILKKKKYLLYSLTEKKKKNVIGLIYVRLLRLLLDTIATTRMSLEVLGIGYNIFQKENYLYFNVGTSNALKWKIMDNIVFTILGKKVNKIKFYTFSKQYLYDVLNLIIKLRKPNIYTGKGIFFYNIKFITKIGKIKKL